MQTSEAEQFGSVTIEIYEPPGHAVARTLPSEARRLRKCAQRKVRKEQLDRIKRETANVGRHQLMSEFRRQSRRDAEERSFNRLASEARLRKSMRRRPDAMRPANTHGPDVAIGYPSRGFPSWVKPKD